MRWVKFLLSLILTLALAGVLLVPLSPTPFALGSFFDPFTGFWQNAADISAPDSQAENLQLPGLQGPVQVVFDERRVPHIFAQHDHDLYLAQGYITARDRLWQMEFQTRASAGRLSEILGRGPEDAILDFDRGKRRKGTLWLAERKWQEVKKDPLTKAAIEAYVEGVNAYIDQLKPKDYPIEFKLIGYEPEPWTPLHSTLLFAYLSDMLGGRAHDLTHTNALKLLGRTKFNTLFPDLPVPERQEPIIPKSTVWPRAQAVPTPPTPPNYHPDSLFMAYGEHTTGGNLHASNNWVVGKTKSATGYPILANDPHLGLNMPAIWYEAQLCGPDHNVYGVSLPGGPGIIIGFTDSVAWGDTNGSRDVLDYYKITYRDSQKKEYRYDGQWLPTQIREEQIKIKGEAPMIDTVWYTHHGPIMYDENFGEQPVPLAVRWMAHEPSNELGTLLRFNRANNYEEYRAALDMFVCPAQNFVFASVAGDIALWQPGHIVNRWPEQGRFVLDGSRKDHSWQGFIPVNDWPHVLNPAEDYITSTNQRPTSLRYPYYYQGYFNFYRSQRIAQLLQSKDTFTVQDMMDYQFDDYGKLAEDILPTLLTNVDTPSLSREERTYLDLMGKWAYQYDPALTAPSLFEIWWQDLKEAVFEDELEQGDVPVSLIYDVTVAQLLKDSATLSYYKQVNTGASFTRKQLISQSFQSAVDSLKQVKSPEWGPQKGTTVRHLARLSPFSRGPLPTHGNRDILNATSRSSGPSWRMVIQLGPQVKAWGIYPGGQSGHPGDPAYDPFIDDWVKGEYYPLHLMHAASDTSGLTEAITLNIQPQ